MPTLHSLTDWNRKVSHLSVPMSQADHVLVPDSKGFLQAETTPGRSCGLVLRSLHKAHPPVPDSGFKKEKKWTNPESVPVWEREFSWCSFPFALFLSCGAVGNKNFLFVNVHCSSYFTHTHTQREKANFALV